MVARRGREGGGGGVLFKKGEDNLKGVRSLSSKSGKALSGLVDIHTHGYGDLDTRSEDAKAIVSLSKRLRKAGTTAFVLSVYPLPIETMRAHMSAISIAMKAEPSILGVHLEGPFLNPVRKGALDERYFLNPTLPNLKKLVSGFEDIVKVITIAPEIKGALKVMEMCAEQGICVSMGHSDASYAQALAGKRAGATGITHLFNAMRPMHHREPGLAGLGLLDEDLYVEVIADGVHVAPEMLRLIFRTKRKERIIIVSDSVMGGTGRPVYKGGVLQGSGTTLKASVQYLKSIGIAEGTAVMAATKNPMRFLRGG